MAIEITAPQLSGSGEMFLGRELWDRQDYNVRMQGGEALRTYEKMRSTDGEIMGSLSRLLAPLRSATWTVEAPKGEDPEKHEPTLFVRDVLFGDGDSYDPVSDTWSNRLDHVLLMLPFGFSVFEKVWGIDWAGRQTWARLAPIMPQTVYKFTFSEDGRLESMTQRASVIGKGYQTVTIPAAKLIVFTFGREGMNLFGRSILRTAWKHWEYKNMLLEVDAVKHERWAVGVPWVWIPGDQQVADGEHDAHKAITKNLRSHERQGVALLPGRELRISYPTGTASDPIASCKYHDQQESRSLITEYMATGTSETGSRAIVGSKMDEMRMAMQGTGNNVEDTFNRQGVVELVERNFGPQKNGYPKLQVEDLDKMSGQQLADISALLAKVGLLRSDKRLRGHYRGMLHLPEEDEATLEEPAPSVPELGGGGDEPDKPGPKPPVKATARATLMDVPAELSRAPLPHESFCAFSEMKAFLANEPKRVWQSVVAPYRRNAIERLAASASKATDAELARGDLPMPFLGRLGADLQKPFLKAYLEGRQSVLDERKRQLGGVPAPPQRFVMQEDAEDEYEVETTAAERDWIKKQAQMFATLMLGALVQGAVRSAMTARQADRSQKEERLAVVDALTQMSEPVQLASLTGLMTRSFTTGRADQASAMSESIGSYFYSAIMDDGTCEPCGLLDGVSHGEDDPTYQTPNPECLGGANCRCITIYVFREEAA